MPERVELPSTEHERISRQAAWLRIQKEKLEKRTTLLEAELEYRMTQLRARRHGACPHRWCVVCWLRRWWA